MKRLFGLLFVFAVFFSFLSNPTSAFAAVTRAEFDTVIDSLYNNEVKFVIDTKGPIGIIPTNSLKSRLYARSDFLFNTYGSKTTTTTASIKSLVAGDWKMQVEGIRYGNEAIFAGTDSIMDNIIISLGGAAAQAGISQQVQAGRMSQEQASQARAAAVAQSNQERAALNAREATECGLTSGAKIVACIGGIVQWLVKNTLMQFAGFFVWLTSNMFNYVIGVGVLNFKDWAPDALYPIWKLIRQAISLVIVFVGLYLGFLYIIGTETSKSKFEKFVPWLLVFALFVNFSYPITRFAVDMSNVVTLTIYTAAVGNAALNGSSGSTAGAIILNRLGLQDLALGATYTEGGNAGANIISNINSVPAAFLAVIFIFYASYIFFMATALIAMRTIALVFLIVGSPLLLIDSVIPILGGKAQEARKIFFEQLAVGPVFMLLLALTMKFLLVFSEGPLKANNGQAGGDPVGVFFNILMMTIMLHLTLKITKDVSGKLGEYATEKMGKVGGFAAGAATGGAGLLARGSIGKLAMKARDSKWVTNNQDSFLGRRMYDMSNSLSKSSFDLRNSTVVAKGAGMVGLGGALQTMGKGRTAGYEEAMEARKKDILARARIKTRYERDITDPKTGQIVHRKGDVDTEAELALDRYTARGGGSLFMAKDELNGYGNRKGVRELLGEQADAESKKRIDEAKSKSEQDIQTYNSIKKDPLNRDKMGVTEEERKDKFRVMLRHELDDLKKVDPGLQGQQAQSLIQTLQKIDEKRSAELIEKYNKTNDPAEKQRVMYDIKSELAAIQTRDGDLESHEAQALLGTLQSIEDINKKAQQSLEEQAQRFVNRYNKIEGNEDEVRTARLRMVNNLEDENLRREVEKLGVPMEKKAGSTSRLVNKDGVAFGDTGVNRSTAPDLDLTYNEWSSRDTPPSMRGTATPNRDTTDMEDERKRKQRDAFARVEEDRKRSEESSGRTAPISIPEKHDPLNDDIAAMIAAEPEAKRAIDKAKDTPTGGAESYTPPQKPIPPAPTRENVAALEKELGELQEAVSGDFSKRLDIIEGFMKATKGTGSIQDTDEYNRTSIEAKKMGFGQSTIEQLYRDATSGTYTEKSIAGTRKNTDVMKARMAEVQRKIKESKETAETV